jgi:hypothetical protein
MKNEIALTASSLTAETLDWFEAARPRVAAYGLLNVFEDRADRLRYRAVEAALAAPKVTKKAKGVGGKKDVQTKLHYRWSAFEAQTLKEMVDTLPGEVSAFAIIREEVCNALVKYQPVLGMVDTSKRRAFAPVEMLLLDDAVKIGRVANLDRVAWCDATAAEFPEDWNVKFLTNTVKNPAALGAVIPAAEADAYRAKVRADIDATTREVYPSVVAV